MTVVDISSYQEIKKCRPTLITLPKEGEMPSQLDHYVQLISNPYIQLICEPLKQIKINYFQYAKRALDSSYIHLTNHTQWQSYYFSQRYYLINEFEDPRKHYKTGLFLWIGMKHQEIYHCMQDHFAIHQGVTFVQTYEDCTEFFHFGSDTKDPAIVNFYLNAMDIFKKFILYFKDKAWDIIEGLGKYRIVLPSKEGQAKEEAESNDKWERINELMDISRYFISESRSDIYLTKREMECLKWHQSGKTAEEIGIILGISKRTVEFYLGNIKMKINCFNKKKLFSNINMM